MRTRPLAVVRLRPNLRLLSPLLGRPSCLHSKPKAGAQVPVGSQLSVPVEQPCQDGIGMCEIRELTLELVRPFLAVEEVVAKSTNAVRSRLSVVELVLTSFGVDADRLVNRHSGHCREHQRGRIDRDRAPSAEAEQPEEIDCFGVELDAHGIGAHRHAFSARCDFDGMAVLAPEGADFVSTLRHCTAQEMENNRPFGRPVVMRVGSPC